MKLASSGAVLLTFWCASSGTYLIYCSLFILVVVWFYHCCRSTTRASQWSFVVPMPAQELPRKMWVQFLHCGTFLVLQLLSWCFTMIVSLFQLKVLRSLPMELVVVQRFGSRKKSSFCAVTASWLGTHESGMRETWMQLMQLMRFGLSAWLWPFWLWVWCAPPPIVVGAVSHVFDFQFTSSIEISLVHWIKLFGYVS